MYTPPLATNLKNETMPQICLGLIGAPGSGKTTACLTAPNPIIFNIDRGLTGHIGKDILTIPVYSSAFIRDQKTNRKDFIAKWLGTEAPKLTSEQTLVIDSWTTLQAAFDVQTEKEPVYTKNGEEDGFAFWKRKQQWSRDICEMIKGLACHVIITFHEQIQRDPTGNPTSKIEPVMQGQFKDILPVYFTDFFRQVATTPKGSDGKPVPNAQTIFEWQTQPDNIVNCKTRLIGVPKMVPANFSVFDKYKQQT